MSEQGLPLIKLDPELEMLIKDALKTVNSKYGSASPNPKPYHNSLHTMDVVESASALADSAISSGKINSNDKRLLIIASAFHDTEHGRANQQNERISASLAISKMRKTRSYSAGDEQRVKQLIMATVVYFDDSGRMQKSATEDYLTRLIADADLAHLGGPTEVFISRVEAYFLEIHKGADLGGKIWQDFLESEIIFLNDFQFYTEEANQLFPNKSENIAYIVHLSESDGADGSLSH